MLEILTPEARFYGGEVEVVTVRTLSGEEGFMADHTWACKMLGNGEIRFREKGSKEQRRAHVSGGFIDVRGEAMIFTEGAKWM